MGIEFQIDFAGVWNNFLAFSSQNPITIAVQLFFKGGWVVFLIILVFTFYRLWLDNRKAQFAGKWKHVLLAIDVPKYNEQSPKAAENIFSTLAAVHKSSNLVEKYWKGKVTESFSFEIVSLEGYVQFLIQTPLHFRDLVEAAIYAQYPEAEITEVEDYARRYQKITFPNERYDLWGTEFIFVKDYPYPIKTYQDFEHGLARAFLDPLADLLEVLSRFGPGEQLWLQLIVTPQPPGWGEKAKKIITEMKGKDYSSPEGWSDKIQKPFNALGTGVAMIGEEIFGADLSNSSKEKEADQWQMFKLSPGERKIFERIEEKTSKHAFQVKFRMVYLGEKENFNKGRGVGAIIGAIQQYNTANANSFKPGKRSKTTADYFFTKYRITKKQNRILRHYISRENNYQEPTENMLLSTEELASLWHFPNLITTKPPAVEKITSRKAVPPSRLPYQAASVEPLKEKTSQKKAQFAERTQPLPETTPETPKKPLTIISKDQEKKGLTEKEESSAGQHPAKTDSKKDGRASPPKNLPIA